MNGPRLLRLALAAIVPVLFGLAGCRQREQAQSPPAAANETPARSETPAKNGLPVEQTPVQSIYEEKPGVLYERPANRTVTPSPARSATPTATPHYPS